MATINFDKLASDDKLRAALEKEDKADASKEVVKSRDVSDQFELLQAQRIASEKREQQRAQDNAPLMNSVKSNETPQKSDQNISEEILKPEIVIDEDDAKEGEPIDIRAQAASIDEDAVVKKENAYKAYSEEFQERIKGFLRDSFFSEVIDKAKETTLKQTKSIVRVFKDYVRDNEFIFESLKEKFGENEVKMFLDEDNYVIKNINGTSLFLEIAKALLYDKGADIKFPKLYDETKEPLEMVEVFNYSRVIEMQKRRFDNASNHITILQNSLSDRIKRDSAIEGTFKQLKADLGAMNSYFLLFVLLWNAPFDERDYGIQDYATNVANLTQKLGSLVSTLKDIDGAWDQGKLEKQIDDFNKHIEDLEKRTGEFVKSIDDYARKAINDLNIRLARAARASQESVLENIRNITDSLYKEIQDQIVKIQESRRSIQNFQDFAEVLKNVSSSYNETLGSNATVKAFGTVLERIDKVGSRIEKLDVVGKKIESFDEKLEKFDELSKKMENIGKKLENLESGDKKTTDIEAIRKSIEKIANSDFKVKVIEKVLPAKAEEKVAEIKDDRAEKVEKAVDGKEGSVSNGNVKIDSIEVANVSNNESASDSSEVVENKTDVDTDNNNEAEKYLFKEMPKNEEIKENEVFSSEALEDEKSEVNVDNVESKLEVCSEAIAKNDSDVKAVKAEVVDEKAIDEDKKVVTFKVDESSKIFPKSDDKITLSKDELVSLINDGISKAVREAVSNATEKEQRSSNSLIGKIMDRFVKSSE